MNYETIIVEKHSLVATITLNRPEVHNSLNDVMIEELFDAFSTFKNDNSRVILMTGADKSFCAGADLNWMKDIIQYSYEQNIKESTKLADLLDLIFTHPKAVVAAVNGSSIGGGIGLMAACDFVYASSKAKFAFTEVKLGLVPSVISPYVIYRTNFSRIKELFISGELFSAQDAYAIGLVTKVTDPNSLYTEIGLLTDKLLKNSPYAISKIKELIQRNIELNFSDLKSYTAELISSLRVSEEGQDGMKAFFEKRNPAWVKDITE